ncbi:hypothetical protein Vretimale_3605, partial [Volvox reticuliferus]
GRVDVFYLLQSWRLCRRLTLRVRTLQATVNITLTSSVTHSRLGGNDFILNLQPRTPEVMHRKTRSETLGFTGSLAGLWPKETCVMEDGCNTTTSLPYVRTVTTACCAMDTDVPPPSASMPDTNQLHVGAGDGGGTPGDMAAALYNGFPKAPTGWLPGGDFSSSPGWSPFTVPGNMLVGAGRTTSFVAPGASTGAPGAPPPEGDNSQAFCFPSPVTALRSHSHSCTGGLRSGGDVFARMPPGGSSSAAAHDLGQGISGSGKPRSAGMSGTSTARRHQRHVSVDFATRTAAATATTGALSFPVELKRAPDPSLSEGGGRTTARSRAGSHGSAYPITTGAAASTGGGGNGAAITEGNGLSLIATQTEVQYPDQAYQSALGVESCGGGDAGLAGAAMGHWASKAGGEDDAVGGRGRKDKDNHHAKEKQRGSNGRSNRELALLDPKRARRIMANRMSAAKSKERKQQYTEQLSQMLDDNVAEREALVQQLQRLQADGVTLEGYAVKARQEAQQMAGQIALIRQHNETLQQQLMAAHAAGGQCPGMQRVAALDGSAGTGIMPVAARPPEVLEILTEALLPEDEQALDAAAMSLHLRQQEEQEAQAQMRSQLQLQQSHATTVGSHDTLNPSPLQEQQQWIQSQEQQQHQLQPQALQSLHRSTQSADATTAMSLASQLGFAGKGVPVRMAGQLAPQPAFEAVVAQRTHSMAGASGLGLGADLGLGAVAGGGLLGAGTSVMPGGEAGRYSLSLPGPIDVARHSTAAKALAATKAPVVTEVVATGLGSVPSSPATCIVGGATVHGDVVMGQGFGKGVMDLGFGATHCMASAGTGFPLVARGSSGSCGGGASGGPASFTQFVGSCVSGGGTLTGDARGSECGGMLAPGPPHQSRQVTTALLPPSSADSWRR